jgi:S-sulfo-L-cysteine synthase (3-phospho-L-serine-dependent)
VSRHIVFVESNTTGTGELTVRRLLDAGDRVTFLTRSPERYRVLSDGRPGLAVRVLETNEPGPVVDAVRELQRRQGLDALLTFSEFYVTVTAEAARACGLRGLEPRASRACRDKHATRRALSAAGLPNPGFWLLRSTEEAAAVASSLPYPCVVKPPRDSSSTGVRLARGPDELLAQVRLLSGWRQNVRGQPLGGEALVETLLEGSEHSVETLTWPGGRTEVVAVVDKRLSAPPWFVEIGHDVPSRADPARVEALAAAARAALGAVGFNFGPAHTELRWTADGPVVVEINARLAGGMIPELIWHATGIDLVAAWLDLLLAGTVELAATRRRAASIRFLVADRAGPLVAVNGLAAAGRLPGVQAAVVSRTTGGWVQPARDAYDRLGYLLAAADDADQVDRDLRAALALVSVEVGTEAVELAGARRGP